MRSHGTLLQGWGAPSEVPEEVAESGSWVPMLHRGQECQFLTLGHSRCPLDVKEELRMERGQEAAATPELKRTGQEERALSGSYLWLVWQGAWLDGNHVRGLLWEIRCNGD